MLRRPIACTTALTSLALLAACGGGGALPADGQGSLTASGGNITGASVSRAGTPGVAGGVAGSSGTSTGSAGGAVTGSGGSGATVTGSGGNAVVNAGGGGAVVSSAGMGAGGTNVGAGGSVVSAGGAGGNGSGGMQATAGTSTAGGSGPDLDVNGKANAAPGATTSTVQDYLRLGEIRILNNNWGSQELGCNAPMSVFVQEDSSFGWTFNRGDCDTQASNQNPDFPQIEFGIHPFGIGNELVTSPEFSSTTLLPLQIKNIQSASVTIDNLTASLQSENSWNITFEFWLSERDPVNDPNPGVYAELMTFWGWQSGRWPSPPNGTGPTGNGSGAQVSSGSKNYTLWVQDDAWAGGKWRYFQFRADDGPQKNFSGKLDVKPFIDYLVNTRGFSPDLWVTRLEVGSEIDDNTSGTVKMNGITFEVNGQNRSEVIAGN